jgi:hypothetical protein
MNGFKWELYDLKKDWTQAEDLAAKMPDKLRDMKELFTMQAAKYNVFPSTTVCCPGSSDRSPATRRAGICSPIRAS